MTNQFIISNPEVDSVLLQSSSEGNFLWAKNFSGTNLDWGNSLATDSEGNVYTTGRFENTVNFDPGAGTFNLTSAGFEDIFISKLDSQGNFLWAHKFGSTGFDFGTSIVTDSVGDVYTTGSFQGTIDFDPGVGTFNLTSAAGGPDIFISKLDPQGNFLWAKSFGGLLVDSSNSLATDSVGNVYTTGSFQDTADFDPGAGTFFLTPTGEEDIFISKLDSQGNFLWARNFGSSSVDSGIGLATDRVGNVYTTGIFSGTVDFDPGAGTFNLTSAGQGNIFISKLDSQGNFLWAKSFGGSDGSDSGIDLAIDREGNVYTVGRFVGTADFDPGAGTFNLTSTGIADIFISKLDSQGNFLWAQNLGNVIINTGGDNIIDIDSEGNVYITGSFFGTVDFDPGAGTFNLTSASVGYDAFISKFDSQGNFLRAQNFGGDGTLGLGLDTDSEGNVYTTGLFYGSADFDPGAGTFNLTSAGESDIFISKLSGLPEELNVIEGTPRRDVLIGTDASDRLTGFRGRDLLLGGAGADEFVYTRISDRLDSIADFEAGSDKIVLTDIFDHLNYMGSDPIADRYLKLFASGGSDTIIFIDPDGTGIRRPQPLIVAENVSVADLNNLDNFVF